jgi:hypothetical protein
LQPVLSSKSGFTLYSVVALLIQVPQPAGQPSPGTYYIVNGVPSDTGERLAATFISDKDPVVVAALDESEEQRVWLDTSSSFIVCLIGFCSGPSHLANRINLSYLLSPRPKQQQEDMALSSSV